MVFAGKHFLNSSLAVPKKLDSLMDVFARGKRAVSHTFTEFRQNSLRNCSLKLFKGSFSFRIRQIMLLGFGAILL